MKRVKQLTVLLTVLLALFAITGCQKKAPAATGSGEREFYQVEAFGTYANFMGINGGWWGKVLKDELNMELNIINPAAAGTGDTLYQTRTAAGNLGEIIQVIKPRAVDLWKAGLLYDMKPLLDTGNYPYLQEKLHVAYERFAEAFDGKGIYAIPGRVSIKPPTTPAGRDLGPEIGTFLRYDYYVDIGSPEINGLEGLLDVLDQMVKAHPVNQNGDKNYAFSSFPDWDNGTVRLAREMLSCLGYTYDTGDFAWINHDGTKRTYFMDDNGEYKQVLKLLNKAYRMGLVDPDSATQNYNQSVAKYYDGRIMFGYWTFMATPIFNRIDLTRRSPYAFVPVKGLVYNNQGYNPYGYENNIYAIGSKAKHPERIMEFYNWLCSPKGILYFNSQIEGVTYEMRDGQPYLTEFGLDSDPDKQAPASLGGGTWSEGIQRLNYPMTHQDDPNELLNGYPINSNMWPSTMELNKNEWNTKWREFYKAETPLEYLVKNNLVVVTPGTDYVIPNSPSDIQTMRNQLKAIIDPAGWQMLYAKTDAEFESIWKAMKAQLDDFGYQEVIAFDDKVLDELSAAIQRTLREAGK
ncbi:hypothetical protein FACS1894109_15470 [Spirochaetia bacterium]|nr:hypothetical protein FACS1894109_15470 [Spirochaetia bacterium]